MGSVGDFIMGGNSQKSKSSNQSQETSVSQNQNVQGSQSTSNQNANNVSGSNNQAYGALNAALNPTLGYVSQGGNMIGALLGLPPVTATYGSSGHSSPMPAMPAPTPSPTPSGTGSSMIDTLLSQYLKSQVAAPSPTPAPTPAPGTGTGMFPPPGSSVPVTGGYSGTGGGGPGIARTSIGDTLYQNSRAGGGAVGGGQPTLVGEKGPEVFVPHTSGTVVPNGVMPMNTGGVMTPGGGGTGAPLQGGRTSLLSGLFGGQGIGGTFLGGGFGHGGVGFGNHGGNPPPTPNPVPTPAPAPVPTPATPPVNPTSALDTFTNSAGMNFILDQGQKAISGASAGNGTFDSGATGKALEQYGQNIGKSYLDDYMNRLLGYSQLGLGSASALSGAGSQSQSVGTSTGNSNSSSFGYGSGSSNLSSSSSGTGNSTGHSKNGLLPDLAAFSPGAGSGAAAGAGG